MARPCGWCSHPERADLERRVASGESIRAVAADAGHSESAAQRHLQNHLGSDLAKTGLLQRISEIADFTDRLIELVDDSANVRAHAKQSTNPRLLLHAIKEERDTLAFVMQRLGITDVRVIGELQEIRGLARVLGPVLSESDPAVAMAISEGLSDAGVPGLADAFLRLSEQASAFRAKAAITTANEPEKETTA